MNLMPLNATYNHAYTGDRRQPPFKNVVTPNTLGLHRLANGGVAELQGGTGLKEQPVFGVSVVQQICDHDVIRRPDLNELFYSRREAEKLIASLQVELPESTLEEDAK